ncbi:efflux RND transporter permease subunit [Stratiformator vulcanicus]|uniref:MMPL family protein n=1 Tax=Stratiformator vulcanicus TaxID=2527980 RepID=A0A517QYY1_9PLAN|nr:MMPL family transporter [Stratiformator vulcanicus]QDT36841.1 MMPL family protein [Stratiformator vulcanicus]
MSTEPATVNPVRQTLEALAIVVAMLAALVFALLQFGGLESDNDVGKWLPANDPQARILEWTRRHFPSEDRIFVTWAGSSLGDARGQRFEAALEKIDGVIDVTTPTELVDRMTDIGVDEDEALDRLEGLLVGKAGRSPVAYSVALDEENESLETEQILDAIRDAAAAADIPSDQLHMGGTRVAGTELDRFVHQAEWNRDVPAWMLWKKSPLGFSALFSAILAVVLLRQIVLAGLVLFVTLSATIMTVAIVPLSGATMNMVLIVMPSLLMVLTLSASIHVANYWKHAALTDRATAPEVARREAAVPCALASMTTAIGLASLGTSPLTPVRHFGLYSAAGCFISLICSLVVLPALIRLLPVGRPRGVTRVSDHFSAFGTRIAQHAVPVSLTCLALFGIAALGMTRFHTETKVIHYFPTDSRIIADYRFIEDELTGIIPVEVVVRFTPEATQEIPFIERVEIVREVERSVSSHPDVTGTLALPDFLRGAENRSIGYNVRLRRMEASIAENDDAEAGQFVTLAREDAIGPQEELLANRGDELWQITAQVKILSDLNYASLTGDLTGRIDDVFSRYTGVSGIVTGTVPLFLRTQQAVLESLIKSFGIAFAVIALLMMVMLRSVGGGVLTMLPNLLPVGLVFGTISWFGLATDIGTMITASVALGIAVDGTLHLITWFRRHLDENGGDRPAAIASAMSHCGPAMWQTSLIVSAGLMMLVFADLLLILRFGWLMASLVGAALIADLVYLPSLLCGPLGRWIVPHRRSASTHDDMKQPDAGEQQIDHAESSISR